MPLKGISSSNSSLQSGGRQALPLERVKGAAIGASKRQGRWRPENRLIRKLSKSDNAVPFSVTRYHPLPFLSRSVCDERPDSRARRDQPREPQHVNLIVLKATRLQGHRALYV
jgi:hypothetical protein